MSDPSLPASARCPLASVTTLDAVSSIDQPARTQVWSPSGPDTRDYDQPTGDAFTNLLRRDTRHQVVELSHLTTLTKMGNSLSVTGHELSRADASVGIFPLHLCMLTIERGAASWLGLRWPSRSLMGVQD